jgi:exopolyphosphatase/guanosine-5'-triphosphate,3'-diphosphate pyrophosphatase
MTPNPEASRQETQRHDQRVDATALAAVDLGSNSFHMVVARELAGQPAIVDRVRDRVAIAEGLSPGGRLDAVAQARALACMERFRERLATVPEERRRAVGTATFRKLRDGGEFLARAEHALGMSIEVLPGREEARLVYLGVAHALGDLEGRRLVVDIGGGSTECILGQDYESYSEDSLAMGCVSWTRRFFPAGVVTQGCLERAELAARSELEPVVDRYRPSHWDHAIGSSGTIRSIAKILEVQQWSDGSVTREGLDRLSRTLIDLGRPEKFDLPELRPDRRGVIGGGIAILRAVFTELGIRSMRPSKGALREGVLYDLLGRMYDDDIREASVRRFAQRFGADMDYADQVRQTTFSLLAGIASSVEIARRDRMLLGWAALLHGIGLSVSYSGYHKHGAYLVENADLAGFSRQDRHQLALLIRCQRHTLRPELLAGLPGERMLAMRSLLPPLRIALCLHRDRSPRKPELPELRYAGSRVRLVFPEGWLAEHPLTRTDFDEERAFLAPMGIVLEVK